MAAPGSTTLRARPAQPGLAHLQDQVGQGAFVLCQALQQGSRLGQGVPLLHPLRLQPGDKQLQVSIAGLSLGFGGQWSPRGGHQEGTVRLVGGAFSQAELLVPGKGGPLLWRCASWGSGWDGGGGPP